VFLTKPKELVCVAPSENIAHEWPLCSVSTEQFDNHAESLCGLWRLNRVAKMESHQLGQSHVLQRFLPADLSSQGESRIQRRNRKATISAVPGRRPRPRECRSYALA
jgi:hypothetical protein